MAVGGREGVDTGGTRRAALVVAVGCLIAVWLRLVSWLARCRFFGGRVCVGQGG